MDEFEKALRKKEEKEGPLTSLEGDLYIRGARWAREWMVNDDNNWALYKAKNIEVKKLRIENQRLREALEKIGCGDPREQEHMMDCCLASKALAETERPDSFVKGLEKVRSEIKGAE